MHACVHTCVCVCVLGFCCDFPNYSHIPVIYSSEASQCKSSTDYEKFVIIGLNTNKYIKSNIKITAFKCVYICILKEKRNATGGNIIFAWLNDFLNSFLEMSN